MLFIHKCLGLLHSDDLGDRKWLRTDFGVVCTPQFNFFLVKGTLNQELKVKETSGKRDRGKFYQHALVHHQEVRHYTLPLLPLQLLLIIIFLLLLLLILLLLLLITGL